jgi:hypothetical protein
MKFFHVYFAFILLEISVFVSGKLFQVFKFKIRNIFDVFYRSHNIIKVSHKFVLKRTRLI